MLTVEKLLKSNELNFQIMAALPAAVVLYFLFSFLLSKSRPSVVYKKVREANRRVHSIITEQCDPSLKEGSLQSFRTWGALIVALDILHTEARLLPFQIRSQFLDDVREVGRGDFASSQRLITLNRMYMAYPFLSYEI